MKKRNKRILAVGLLLILLLMTALRASAMEGGPSGTPAPTEDSAGGAQDGESVESRASSAADGTEDSEGGTEDEGFQMPGSYEEWEEYLMGTIVPYGSLILGAVFAIYLAISPVLSKVKLATSAFHAATDRVNVANGISTATQKQNSALLSEMRAEGERQRVANEAFAAEMQARMAALTERTSDILTEMEASTRTALEENTQFLSRVIGILRVGFCNNRELVSLGHAKQIARIAAGVADSTEDSEDGREKAEAEEGSSVRPNDMEEGVDGTESGEGEVRSDE